MVKNPERKHPWQNKYTYISIHTLIEVKRERKGSWPWSQKRRSQWQRGKWRQQRAQGFRYDPQSQWSSSWFRTDKVFGKPKAQQLSTASLSPSTPLTSLPSSSSKAGSLRLRRRVPLLRRRWAAASPFFPALIRPSVEAVGVEALALKGLLLAYKL